VAVVTVLALERVRLTAERAEGGSGSPPHPSFSPGGSPMVRQRFFERLNAGLERLNAGLVLALAFNVAIWMVLVALVRAYVL
jgi:hypothetical protein